jgi:tetrachlorobenzoquinone reductase
VFRDELEGRADVTLHYSRGVERNAKTLGAILERVDDNVDIYCCGPARMLDEFARLTAHRPASRNHVERFAAASVPLANSDTGVGEFVVQLRRSGVEIAVGEKETVLEALLREDVDVPYSCEEGICGACETKVLEGEPLHGDSIRSPDEHTRRGTVMVCCARSRSARLVLDL